MENLAIILEPHENKVGLLASIVAMAQYVSGAVLCKSIYDQRSTIGVSAKPFLAGMITAILMFKYALILNNTTLLMIYLVSTVFHTLYTIFYNYYTEDKVNDIYIPLSYGITLVTVLYSYADWEDPKVVEHRFGLIVTLLVLALLSSPLLEVAEIIHTKDASRIPIAITLMASIGSITWILYGIALRNNFMIVQHVVTLLLCAIQLGLYLKYPKEAVQH